MNDDSRVEMQIMWNRLLSVVEEQAQVLLHTAFSPIVRECGDISAGIFDRRGRMLAQAVTGTPGHINTMAESVRYFIDEFEPETMNPGDVYLTNDPWLASGHLNDFMLVEPVFLEGTLVAFVACTSHLIDLGGLGMGPQGSDVFDEGFLVPPCRLVDKGEANEFLIHLIKANSRSPVENEGDIYALIACCDVGCARLAEMMREFRVDSLEALSAYVVDTSRRATEDAIEGIPNGVYRSRMRIDGYDFEIDLAAALHVEDRGMLLDLDGSSSCSRFGINVPINYTTAYSVFGIRCIVAPEVPNNAGSLAPFRVQAPSGSIVNAPRPAPVAMRHTIGQLMPDLVFGCLHQALPGRVPAEGASTMWDLPLRSAFDAGRKSNARAFAVELTHNGGTGARPTRDGLSATAYPSGVWGSQVEITESVAPLRVRRRELRPDSGGAGTHRGGLGQVLEVESRERAPFHFLPSVERIKFPARGRDGGADGAAGRITLESGAVLSGKGDHVIPGGDCLIFETPGGAGYGVPEARNPRVVIRDVRDGVVTPERARDLYRVAVDEAGGLDDEATARLRESAPAGAAAGT